MKILVIILLIIGYLIFGAFGSYLLAKDWKRSFGKIEGCDTPIILFCGLALGYLGFFVGIFVYFLPRINKFISAHTKRLTQFLNEIIK